MNWNCTNGYIEQFDPNYRGTIGDRFCRAVRAGNEDVRSILDAVREDVEARSGSVWQQVARTLETTEAWDFAQHILDRESLPYDEYAALKNAKQKENANYVMDSQPPTEKQLNYLKDLRCSLVPTTKLEARDLINGLLKK